MPRTPPFRRRPSSTTVPCQRLAEQPRVDRLRGEAGLGHRPRRVEIEQDEVGRLPHLDPRHRQPEEPSRAGGHALEHEAEVELARLDEVGVDRRERRLEAGDTERRLLERRVLLVPCVRRVIGGDAGDRAVAEPLEQRLAIVLRAERRVHLAVGVESAHSVVGEAEVVGRDLRADGDPARLRGPNGSHGLPGREMHYMQRSLLICGEFAIAPDHHGLRDRRPAGEAELGGHRTVVHLPVARERRFLLVQRQQPAGNGAVLERALHQPGRDDRAAVVRERRRTETCELGHLGQLLPLEPLRDRRHEAGRNDRVLARLLDQGAEHRGRVDDGIGVGHREDCAVAAGRGGGSARRDRLLVLATRHAQVHVRIDERGSEHEPTSQLDGRVDGDDDAVLDRDVEGAVEVAARVDHPGAANREGVTGRVRPDERHATSRPRATSIGPPASRS